MSLSRPHLALVTCHSGNIGGMEKFARFLVHTLLSADWRVTVALSGENIFLSLGHNFGQLLSVDRVNWTDASCAGDRHQRLSTVLARRRWFRHIRPDVAVFVQSSNTPFRASVAGAAMARVPVVITHRTMPYVIPHVPSQRYAFGLVPGLGLYRRKMVAKTRLVAALSARIVYNSEQVRREYERDYAYPESKGVVIPNALETLPYEPEAPAREFNPNASANAASSPSPLTIGYVGRLSREKHLDVLIQAFAALPALRPVRLAFWGDGALQPHLQALATELNVADRITWHGPTGDTASAYRQCDIVVLCSPRESSSNMVLEAMAAGRAVVVTAVGGQPELVDHGRCGLIVPPNDPAALAGALDGLLAGDTARQALGQHAREFVHARHDPRSITDTWIQLLSEVAGRITTPGSRVSDNTRGSKRLVPVDLPHL